MSFLFPEITGVILAGGKSRRFGKNKALAQYKGKTFVERIFGVLKPLFPQVILITNTPEDYSFLPLPIFCDEIPQQGPLGGIYTALNQAKTDRILVVACDLPLIHAGIVGSLVENFKECDAVIPIINGQAQYLFALYSKSLLPTMKVRLEKKELSMKNFCRNCPGVRWVPLLGSGLFNINTPEDLEKMEQINA